MTHRSRTRARTSGVSGSARTVPARSRAPQRRRAREDLTVARERPAEYDVELVGGVPTALERLTAAVDAAVDAPVEQLSSDALRATLRRVRRARSAMALLEARVLAACTAAGAPREDGAASTVGWVRSELGVSGREAKSRVELADTLARLPSTANALRRAEISEEHAARIARSVKGGRLGSPAETEDCLLDAAVGLPPEEFAREVARREEEADGDALRRDEVLAHSRRSVRRWRGDDGMLKLFASLDPVNGEKVATALDAFERPDPAGTPVRQRRSPDQRRADALLDVVEAALAAGDAPLSGGVRPHISVLVPWETLAGDVEGRVGDSGRGEPVGRSLERPSSPPGEAAWSGPISADAVRRLACDAGIARIVTRGASQVLDVGRAERTWSAAQRRAVVARDGGCRFPSCDRPAGWCEIHHVRFWTRDDGTTDLDNGVLLCSRHHHQCHEGGWSLQFEPATAQVTVVSPDGARTLHSTPRGPMARLAAPSLAPPGGVTAGDGAGGASRAPASGAGRRSGGAAQAPASGSGRRSGGAAQAPASGAGPPSG